MKNQSRKPHSGSKTAAIIFLCFVASFFGSWLFLSTGLVRQDVTQTINNNRDNIVLQESEVLSDVAESVSPSVVSIVRGGSVRTSFGGRVYAQPQSSGTGIVIAKNGYIMTNKHVLEGAGGPIRVIMSDGTRYDNIQEIGQDPLNDIAFLQIQNVDNLRPAKLGNSRSVKIGEKVVAIGNALGQFKTTVTSGIISGIGRPIVADSGDGSQERLEGLLQTDAAINPGNSGGPLVNLAGEVIGMNTAVAAQAEGIGFAIPINATKGLVRGVIDNGKIERPYLGVQYISVDPEVAEEFKLSTSHGAYIYSPNRRSAVIAGGPAAKAGLKNRDIITKVNNVEVSERDGLSSLLSEFRPGQKVNLTILRSGEEHITEVTLGKLEG